MMQASFQFGVLPILKKHDSSVKNPTKEWFVKWFGSYSLRRLAGMARRWEAIYTQFSAARMGIYSPEISLRWRPVLEKSIEFENYYVIELTSQHELETEGHALNHCVGSYTIKCLFENSWIFSIRDKFGGSLSTFEMIFENNQFVIAQHFASANQEPVNAEKSIALSFLNAALSRVSLQSIAEITVQKRALGKQFQDYLAGADSLCKQFTSKEQSQLSRLVAFTHPKKARTMGIYKYLKIILPNILRNRRNEAAEAIEFFSQDRNEFSLKGKNLRFNTIKNNNTSIVCFIHDAEKHYSCSYYGTVFINQNSLVYRVTGKSPRDEHSYQVHNALEELFKGIDESCKMNAASISDIPF